MTRRIMFHNPVGNGAYDGMFAEVLSRYRLPGTEIHVTSLPPEDGAFSHIEYRAYEGRVTSGIIRSARAAAREGFDAFVIGCFYDTGLHDAREVSGDMIVTAPASVPARSPPRWPTVLASSSAAANGSPR